MKKQKIFVIGGPTASGKSSLAVRLATDLNGCVVNADSIQVYKDLRVLSARPSDEEMQGIPHYLFGYVDAWTNPSLADWLDKAKELLPDVKNPIVVGGTGLYLEALMHGVSPIPDVDLAVRERVRNMDLKEVQSLIKNPRFKDPQRLRRALEVQLTTGKTLDYFYQLPKKKSIDADFYLIYVLPQREKVYEACEKRFVQMLQAGALEEVRHLNDIQATGGVLKAIGVPEIQAYFLGRLSKDEMIQQSVIATRQYAKRQMTWFRHHGSPRHIVTDAATIDMARITE